VLRLPAADVAGVARRVCDKRNAPRGFSFLILLESPRST
jgi:hypothetical protein